jgi:PAS domain S-box-containing protein
VRKDGTRFWAEVALTALRSPDGTGAVRGFIKITHDISERRLASQAMAESRSQMARILESAMDAIITVDTDQRVTLFNAAAVAMFRCTLDEALGAPLERFIPQRYRAAHAEHIRAFAETGTTSRAMGSLGTLYGVRSNGEEFPIEASISQVEVSGRKVFTVILRDITERERAEGQQSLLLHELAHRVKNSLAVVQSIAAQTRRFALPEQFDATFDARLRALGASHDLLTQSEWEGATLADVVSFSLKPYGSRAQLDRWTTAGPDIWLFPNEAVTLGLAFHELATNAAKFGALSNATGTIAISWDVKDDDQPGSIEIKWLESGGPPVQPPSRKGFGSTLLDRALAHELSGTALLCFAPEGFVCTLCFPLSQKVKLRT